MPRVDRKASRHVNGRRPAVSNGRRPATSRGRASRRDNGKASRVLPVASGFRHRRRGWLGGAGRASLDAWGESPGYPRKHAGRAPAQAGGTVTLTGTGGESGDAKGVTARSVHEPAATPAPEPEPAAPAAPQPKRAAREPGSAAPAGPATAARLRLPAVLAVALAGGLALVAAFPPIGIWPLAPAGPALLAVALWRRGPGTSLLAGLAF